MVSAAVLATVSFEQGYFRTFIEQNGNQKQLPRFSEGGVISTHQADEWLAQILDELNQRGARCLIVEDDLASSTDPYIVRSEDAWAFIGTRVLAWSDLEPNGASAALEEIQGVGSGYPRNMFVSARSAAELGLADRQQVPEDFPARVERSLLAVILAIFDAESYLVWTSHR
jgi:hypothetical protein